MPLDYRYEAVDAAGRRLNGTLTADSEKDARRKLFEQGLVVSKLQGEAKAKTSWDWRRLFNKPLSTTELILFTQQFRTLYMAGISLPEALRILHDQAENKQFKWVVGDMQRRVLEGESLHQAFSANRKVFSSLYCAMIAAGESSGALPEVLERLVYLLEHDAKTKQQITSALRYPKMVVFAMVIAFLVLLNFVVPQFASIFRSAKVELPLPTQFALWLNQFFQDYWFIILALFFGFIYAWKAYMKTEKGVFWRDSMALKIPLIGKVVQKAAIARFAAIFSILQRSGLSVLNSLDIIRDTVDNAFFQTKFEGIKSKIQAGSGIAAAVESVKGFTPLAVNLILVGEHSGKLDEMLNDLARHYDNEVELAVEELTEWIGPILIMALGVVVLFFALSIFLPMWDLVKLVQ